MDRKMKQQMHKTVTKILFSPTNPQILHRPEVYVAIWGNTADISAALPCVADAFFNAFQETLSTEDIFLPVDVQAESEAKLKQALTQDMADTLPAGQPEEEEVTVAFQRDVAERLQKFFEDFFEMLDQILQ